MLETVTLDGVDLKIKEIEIGASAEEAVREAHAILVPPAMGLVVAPGDEVTIRATGDVMLTGQIRDVMPSHDADDHMLEITICSKTVDATETSIEHDSGEIRNQPLDAAAREFDSQKIGIECDEDLPLEPRVKIKPGETLFSALERVSRGRGILIYDTPEGRLKLATKPEGTHDGALRFGVNIERATATLTERGRYNPVIVRGQSSEAADIDSERFEAEAKDDTVSRRRPMIITLEGQATPERMQERAAWAVQRNAGAAIEVNITVTGWRDDAGKLWQPNYLVAVYDPWLGLDGSLVIKTVTFRQSSEGGGEGTVADLVLVDPRALGGENPRGKSDKAYKAKSKGKAKSKSVDWVAFKEQRDKGEW